MSTHTLTWLLVIPAIASVAVLAIPSAREVLIKRFSIGIMLVEFVVSLRLIFADYSTPGYRLVEQVTWVESLGISYKLGVDGLSLWLVLLTTALTPIALYASWGSVTTKIKEYAFSFLLLELGMLGAFIALDLFLFYVFWELMLVPMYLIIGVWGGKDRVYAAVKFFLYTFFGSLLMLVAILYIVATYKEVTGQYTFDLEELTALMLPAVPQYLLFSAFALAFAIKVPMFPFHTWLPDAHVQAPTGGSVILAAVLLKLGIYGFIRFAMPLFPIASQFIGPTLAGLGVLGIIYGAYAAWVQRDLKKLVAYSSVSHMGFILLGLFAMNRHGVSGAILQMINHGVSTGALFLLVGVIYDRRHSRMLDDFGGLAKVMPWYATAFVIITMSSIGLPGTNGFVGEFMILGGAFFSRGPLGFGSYWFIMTLLAATGVIFAAVYMLHAVLRMFWGKVTHEENQSLPDLNRRETWALIPLVALVFWIGLYPNFFLDKMNPSVDGFISDFSIRYRQSRGISKPQLADLQAVDPDASGAYALAHPSEEGR
jgi:NADH-quinone oxidoreductase subunit M